MAYIQPNYYQSQYGNPYMGSYSGINYQPQQYNTQPITQQNMTQASQQQQVLYGKVVDCFETAKSQDVPLGMSGIYPQADGKIVFIKKWLENGTTVTDTYKLLEQTSVKNEEIPAFDWSEKLDNLCDEITALSKKIDKIKVGSSTTTPMKKRKVEVDEDDA